MTAPTVTTTSPKTAIYTPTPDDAIRLFEKGDLLPVYRSYAADLETPVSVYLKLAQPGEPVFFLESVEGGESVGRYSFIGINPTAMLTVRDNTLIERRDGQSTTTELPTGEDALDAIRDTIGKYQPIPVSGLPRFVGGAVGFFAYDIVRKFERLPETATDELDLPDAAFMIVDTLVMFDHVKHHLLILSNARNEGDPAAAYEAAVARIDAIYTRLRAPLPIIPENLPTPDTEFISNKSREEYEAMVLQAKEYIAAGDAFQIVPSRRLTRETNADPFSIYRALRMINPSPYMFFLRYPEDDITVIGASPEMLVRYEAETNIASVRPIAGTIKRGATPAEDLANEQHMITDPKERAEHLMLVDLGRNDLGRVCDYGSVTVPEMFVVERYSHVMHIVSHVEGKLRRGMDAFSLVRATFPAGTLTGAPKIRAMEIIEELEGTRRGLYGGSIGYFSYDGSMDMCITIRTMLMRGKRVYLQAGGGVVADSVPSAEYEETENKARAVAVAIQNAENNLF
jgi:anthranilate synthase component I